MPLLGRERVQQMTDDAIERMNTSVKGVYFAGLADIVKGTPADKGATRNGWRLSVGAPSQSTTTSKNKQGSSSLRQIFKMPAMVLGEKIYYTNNTAYIGVLEYGGFPSPVEKGSYIKRSKSYEILSVNGFSKQAPNGWVRIALKQMQAKIRSL